jgi:hypothetical protein
LAWPGASPAAQTSAPLPCPSPEKRPLVLPPPSGEIVGAFGPHLTADIVKAAGPALTGGVGGGEWEGFQMERAHAACIPSLQASTHTGGSSATARASAARNPHARVRAASAQHRSGLSRARPLARPRRCARLPRLPCTRPRLGTSQRTSLRRSMARSLQSSSRLSGCRLQVHAACIVGLSHLPSTTGHPACRAHWWLLAWGLDSTAAVPVSP